MMNTSVWLIRVSPILVWWCTRCQCACGENYLSNKDNLTSATTFLDDLLHGYDRRLTPTFTDDRETIVTCDVFVSIISSIEEYSMDYGVTIFLRQTWTDPRLRHPPHRRIPSSSQLMNRIWVPDLFFTNEKKGIQHELTVENKLLRISHTGEVMISQRVSLILTCHMDLRRFPMDHQECDMQMESFGYTTDQLRFEWKDDDKAPPVQVTPNLPVTQFVLFLTKTRRCDKVYWTGNFTCISVSFHFTRELGFYLLSTYCPTFSLVILSWISFWMCPDAAPARISLGITVILTTTAQAIGMRESFAKVSYITAMDIWMSTCLTFVMASIVEFSIVNFLYHLSERHSQKQRSLVKDMTKEEPHGNGWNARDEDASGPSSSNDYKGVPADDSSPHVAMFVRYRELALSIDNGSKCAFPAAFLVFNVVYWSIYTSDFQLL